MELQLSKYININHSFQGNVLNGLYPYLMTCFSQHLETSNQKTDAILDENGYVKHGQETVSSAIPEKHEQGSITVVPETQESVSSTLRSVVPETQESDTGTELTEVHGMPTQKIVVPETQGAEHVVLHEQSDVRAIPETQETPDVHQVEETRVHETVLPECVVKVARLPEAQLAKGIEFCE